MRRMKDLIEGMTCVHCARRRVPEGYQTCGDSYCQEASHHANGARVARGQRRKERCRRLQREAERKLMIIIVLAMFLPGCNSFGLTPGYVEKYPDLLENTRHFYSEPLWTRRLHCGHQRQGQ